MSRANRTLFVTHVFVNTAWQHVAFASELEYVSKKLNCHRVTNFRNKHSKSLLREGVARTMCVDFINLLEAVKTGWIFFG